MTFKGKIKNGVVILDGDVKLPEGAEVELNLPGQPNEQSPTLYERLKPVIGIAKGLPSDASKNVDHYLYGHPHKP